MSTIQKLNLVDFPSLLREITDPPKELYLLGTLPDPDQYTYLTIVGSRHFSSYGKEVCQSLISGLAGQNIVIVSGLALGIDTIAHKSALASNLLTVAVPGSGLAEEVLYPRSNLKLASEILDAGGALLSELPPDTRAAPYTFPRRNRIMAGLAQATLIIEATDKSGTLITARLAMEYNREVLAVPGSIFSSGSTGPLKLIRDGATPITSSNDILEALGLATAENKKDRALDDLSATEKLIYEMLIRENLSKDDLIEKSKLSSSDLNIALTMLELKNLIKEVGGEFYTN